MRMINPLYWLYLVCLDKKLRTGRLYTEMYAFWHSATAKHQITKMIYIQEQYILEERIRFWSTATYVLWIMNNPIGYIKHGVKNIYKDRE